jgi:ATP-binding cassette subfamily C protein
MLSHTIRELRGEGYSLRGNEPIMLDNPQQVWVVQSGAVALFAVTVREGSVDGTRRYLFSIDAGGALFGTAANAGNRQILAVPIGETRLLQLDWDCFAQLVANADSRAVGWLEHWVKQLAAALPEITLPTTATRCKGGGRFSLIAGETLQPETGEIVWVQVQQGEVHWLGVEALPIAPKDGIFPISDRMGLQAPGEVQLVTEATPTLHHAEALLAGLSQLHLRLLHAIHHWEQQEQTEEMQRLRERERLNRQVTAEALGKLAASLGSQETDSVWIDDHLLIAAGAVGRVLGIPISPPPSSLDPKRVKEPLEAIARASRARIRRVLLRDKWWRQDCGPLIAYTAADNRPMALLPVSANRYHLFDPIHRTRIPVNERVASTLTPVAHTLYRSLPNRVLKATDLLRFALKGRLKDVFAIVLTGIAVTLLGMLVPQATAISIDSAIPDSDRGLLLQVGLGLLVAAIVTAAFRTSQGLAILRLETGSDASTQAAVWDRLLNLPVSFFRRYTVGDLQSRVTSISQIRRQLSGTTLINLTSALFALLNLALLLYYSVKLALIAVAVAVVVAIATTTSGALLLRKVRPLLELQGAIFGQTIQLVNGISKLRVTGAEERAFATWSQQYSRQIERELSTQHVEDGVVLFNTLMPTLASALLFWFAVQLLNEAQTAGEEGLTLGTFLAFNTAFGTFIRGATDLSNTATGVLQVIPQWKRAQPILEAVPEVDLSKADPGKLTGKIAVERVTFRYRDDGPLTLDEVSICAEPGEFVAFVGGSGSGKSTLFRLLLGFETPESGTIYYDGQDLAGLDIEAVRRQLGVVLQSGRIASASLFENIAGGAQITLDEAWEAARMAGLADDIAAMPMAMHTVVSEGGGNLSGGQRQRLAIARALALKPRILLFDEATSALDNRTQAIVSESLDRLQVTRFVIAHRLSTIRNADRIYVLQAGRVVQQGRFEALANEEGLFAQLMARQVA